MNEHDDDLESTVHVGAETETDVFPDTADELESAETDETEEEDLNLDEDEAEL